MSQTQNPQAPSLAQLFATINNCAPAPQTVGQSSQALHGQSATGDRSSRFIPAPHVKIAPAPSSNPGMMGQAPPPNTSAAMAVGFQGHSHGIQGNSNPNAAPTFMYDMTGRVGGGHPASTSGAVLAVPTTTTKSYIAELQRGNVGVNCVWRETVLERLAEFEPEILRILEEKGRAFWKLWVDLHEPQSEPRDKDATLRFVARQLRSHPWFKGDETVAEAIEATQKIQATYIDFVSPRFLMPNNRMPQGVGATMVSQAEAQMRTDGGTHFQAQVREVEDVE